jgi:hypothetical protein
MLLKSGHVTHVKVSHLGSSEYKTAVQEFKIALLLLCLKINGRFLHYGIMIWGATITFQIQKQEGEEGLDTPAPNA